MNRILASILAPIIGALFVWGFAVLLQGNVSDVMSYIIPAVVYFLIGLGAGRFVSGSGYPYYLAILFAAPMILVYLLAAVGGDVVDVPPAQAFLMRAGSALFIPIVVVLGVWVGKKLRSLQS